MKEEEKKVWTEAMPTAEEEERKAKEHPNDKLRLFHLSRKFPMFNDKAIPVFNMNYVVCHNENSR